VAGGGERFSSCALSAHGVGLSHAGDFPGGGGVKALPSLSARRVGAGLSHAG
jgi:hypothetical protein